MQNVSTVLNNNEIENIKLTNISNYTQQELQDIIIQVQSYMRLNDLEETVIDLVNYQKQFEDGNTYNLTGKVAKKMKKIMATESKQRQ